MNISEEYITKNQAMKAYCEHFCHPGSRCPDGYCREVRDAFGPLESVAFIIDKNETDDYHNLYDDGYNEGLRAVECMLHVFFKNCPLRPGFGMEKQDIIEVFGTDNYGDIFANNSIKDFLEKMDEWACKKDLAEEENK